MKATTLRTPASITLLATALALLHSLHNLQAAAPNEGFSQAQWITPATDTPSLPLFRKEFITPQSPKSAFLRIVGLGDYYVEVNDTPITPTGINQAWSQYDKTLYSRDLDILPALHIGTNCVGIMLANSFWHNPNSPAGRYNKDGPQRQANEPLLLAAELWIQTDQGKWSCTPSDSTWTTSPGPITFSHIFAGEDYDARLRKPGWSRPHANESSWQPSRIAKTPSAKVQNQAWPAIQPQQVFQPNRITQPEVGTLMYHFPQNSSAQLRFKIHGGKPGATISFKCGEHRNQNGRLFGNYLVDCSFITDGSTNQHQWISFYLGMQFVEVTGAVQPNAPNPDHLPVIDSMELVHVRAALPETGTFESSSQLYNQTHTLIDWAMRSNMSHVLSDCPHREKLGWLECAYLLAPSFQYRYDSREWQAKLIRDILDAQEPSGRVLTVAPSYPAGRFPGAFNWTVEWGAAAVMLPWLHYVHYGDSKILRQSLPGMRAFVDYIGTQATNGIAPGGLGDWYDYGHGQPPGPSRYTPTELTATATWALCAKTVAQTAEALNNPDTALQYHQLHADISETFRKAFQDPQTRSLKHHGSPQCANAIAICAEVVDESDYDFLLQEIIDDLANRDWQQTPGDVGHVYFIRALAQAGRSDVLHKVYSRTGPGSYGGILAKGLTSLPETWDAMMDGYQSLNHCMLGHVMEWFHAYVGGIRQAPDSVGWNEVLIAPEPGELKECRSSLITPKGRIAVEWKVMGTRLTMEVDVPPSLKATAILPSGKHVALTPGHQTVQDDPDQTQP
ncbi:MAG: hypothetical protein RI897_401 [Verrucomicrobiota bacterium]|jgi:hypothetical protein